ncbi:MAG: hypothetical protein K9H48_07620 [Melioribacteraceae bacterium]|nr:hypothetical protein [Melioribacteraceae bacterium]
MSLKNVYIILEKIATHSGRIDKENLIKANLNEPYFRKVMYYALNKFIMFNTTRISFLELDEQTKEQYLQSPDNIFQMLDYLSQKTGATDDDITWLSGLSSFDQETVEVVRRIINKDLRCGVNVKTAKKFIPEIPSFELMLCEKDLDVFLKKYNYDFKRIVGSNKIDGVRSSAQNGVYLSRSGKEFPNFDVFDNDIKLIQETGKKLFPDVFNKDVPIDGEVIADVKDKHKFQKIMTQVRRLKEVDNSLFKYKVFDIVAPDLKLLERYKILSQIFKELEGTLEKITLIKHYSLKNFKHKEQILDYADKLIEEGEEGLVLKDIYSYYEHKRSSAWCKITGKVTLDCKVTGWEYGEGKYEDCVGKLNCILKDGTTFKVSGMTDEERIEFMENTPNIIEIQFKEYTKAGKPRNAFFVRVREDKTEID